MMDRFDITPVDSEKWVLGEIGWYSIQGFTDRGASYRLVRDNEGTKLTYYRPAHWTDEDWEEFCDEMEEDVCGPEAD